MRRIRNAQSELLDDAVCIDGANSDTRGFPERPAIPVALALAVGIWGGSAAVLSSTMQVDAARCLILALALAVAAACALALWWRFRAQALVWMLAVGLLLGGCLGATKAATLHRAQASAENLSGRLTIVAAADGSQGAYGTSCLAYVSSESSEKSILAIVSFPDEIPEVTYGEAFTGYGSVSVPSETRAAYCWEKGAAAQVKLRTCDTADRYDALGMLVSIRKRAVALLTQPQRIDEGLAAALVCGWRGNLPEEVYQDFQVSGLAHVVAVSGAHLSIVVAFVASVMRLLHLPRTTSTVLQIALVVTYLVLTALPVSAIRAAVMTIAGLLSWTACRRSSSLSALSICIAGMVALDPQVSLSASFALSATSTLGIVVFGTLFDRWIERFAPRLPAFACEALALTFASSVLATPISASLFSQLPLIAPIANLASGPLFGPICTLGIVCAAAGVAFPGVASLCAAVACAAASLLRMVVHAVASIPYASVPVTLSLMAALTIAIISSIALWLWWPKPQPKHNHAKGTRALLAAGAVACALVITLGVGLVGKNATEIAALDVGQGDAILVRSQGKSLLIDTGNQDTMLREALARQGVAHLDAIVITHPDDDHMGSLASLRGVVQVDRVLIAADARTCKCSSCATLRTNAEALAGPNGVGCLSKGDVIALGAFSLTCIWPQSFTDEGGNADSVCLRADTDLNGDGTGEWSALLVGDAEHDQLEAMLASGDVSSVDVYKVGHHGSKNALTDEQAQTLQPSISLVSVGAHNRYGHPASNTVEALQAAGSEILRTDEHGDVVCRFTEERIDVRCLR